MPRRRLAQQSASRRHNSAPQAEAAGRLTRSAGSTAAIGPKFPAGGRTLSDGALATPSRLERVTSAEAV